MRPLLPLVCGLVAGLALNSAVQAEDTAFVQSAAIEASTGGLPLPASAPAVASDKAVALLPATPGPGPRSCCRS